MVFHYARPTRVLLLSFFSRGWNGCASRTMNLFRGSPTRLARRVSRRLCRRSEEAEAVRGRRKAGTDQIFLFGSLRGGLADPRLRASNEGLLTPQFTRGSRQIVLPCAHRATTALSWGLCEQEERSAYSLASF